MCDSRATDSMIKWQHTKPYKRNISSNKVEYSRYAGPYCTKHCVKVTFFMPEFYRSRIMVHFFHGDKNESESGIGCDIFINHNLMVQLGLLVCFKNKFLQCDGLTVPIKEPRALIGKTDQTSHNIYEVEIQTAEPVPTRGATEK